MERRSFLAITAAGTLALALPRPAAAGHASRKLGKIAYGVAGLDPLYAAAYVAYHHALLALEGLEVDLLNSESGPRSNQLLANRQLFVTAAGVDDSIALTLAGKAATLVLGLDNRVPFANILVRKDLYDSGKLRRVEDLAAQTIAVTQPQATSWLMATYILERAGLKDRVQVKGLGDVAAMMDAVKTRQVAATIATVSMVDVARREGWGAPIFEVSDTQRWNALFGGDVPSVGCYVLADSVKRRPEIIQAFVNAIVKATDMFKATSPEAIADMIYARSFSGFPRESLVRGLAVYKTTWNYTNIISKDGYERLIGIMAGRQYTDEELRKAPYETVVDMSFVKKARKIG